MASIKKEIFLASRFEEFKDIRKKLATKIDKYPFMEAVDLNDNQASHRSPLEESLFHVRKSEIMILLVGETYGTIPEGEDKSYTHLEYVEAIKESSNTRVLVFCIGDAYAAKFIEYSKEDANMKKWQIELEKNHRLSKFGNKDLSEEISEKIMIMLLSSVYDLNPDENLSITQDDDLYLDMVDDSENFLYDDEVEFLDNKFSERSDIGITDVDNKVDGFELLKIPGKLAALEQKKEAQMAIELQDYYTAKVHLQKALEFRPLDFETNYWLAKLYVTSAKKNLFIKIEEYLLRAAKIALQDNNKFKASHCYQLIIQASIFSDKENEGFKYIDLAEELTPNFARLYYEKAKFMLNFSHYDEAKRALIQAMNIRMEILGDISKDPFFLEYKQTVNEVKMEMKEHLQKSCYAIASQTNDMKDLFNLDTHYIDLNRLSVYALWKYARRNFVEQYKLLSDKIGGVKDDQIVVLTDKINELNRLLKVKDPDLIIIDNIIPEVRSITSTYKEKISAIQSSSKNTLIVLIVAVLSGIVMVTEDIGMTSIWVPIVITLAAGAIWGKLKSKKVKATQSYKKKVEDIKSKISGEVNSLQKKYANITGAFNLFESKTVSKSSSKLVPLRSLNNASYGSVVRVTPFSYKKYLEHENSIKILEDFPTCLGIEKVDTENYSFLGKVVEKKNGSIVLSRAKAYE